MWNTFRNNELHKKKILLSNKIGINTNSNQKRVAAVLATNKKTR